MDNYPKIYSINTVGIRQHYNADYLLHPIRTDFTGNNGVGKSIIADLMQLIFIPHRNDWKSGGTEDNNAKNLRKIETIPLQKEFIQFAYVFLNIERSKGKYVTIGVYIPRNTTPIRPFIISKNPDESNLKSYNTPLFSKDFISQKRILDIVKNNNELGKHLYDKYDLHLHSFYQSEEIKKYHQILYNNLILDIDLTISSNYQSFAKILQSFARAKTLNINKSNSLKEFLFEDNAYIKKLFDEQKEELIERMKQYRETDNQIQLLTQKQNALSELKKLETNKNEAFENYLKADTSFAYYEFLRKKQAKESNEKKLKKATQNKEKYKKEQEQLKINIQNTEIEYSKADKTYTALNEYNNLYRDYQDLNKEPNQINDKIIDLKGNKSKLEKNIENLSKQIEKVKSEIPSPYKIAEKEKLHKKFNEKLIRLKQFENFKSFTELENLQSEYEKNVNQYSQILQNIDNEIKSKHELLKLYTNNRSNSLFNWAIKNDKNLNIYQESILFYFKSIYTIKPDTYEKFVLNPDKLLNSDYELTENNGFWIRTGEINEFIPLVSKQVFRDTKTLKELIEKEKEQIKFEISNLKNDKNTIKQHDKDTLNKHNINSDFLQFPTFEQLEDLFNLYQENLKENFSTKNEDCKKEYESLLKLQGEKENEINRLSKELNDASKNIGKITKEIQEKEQHLKELQENINNKKEEIAKKKAEIDFEFETNQLKELIQDYKDKKDKSDKLRKKLNEKGEKVQEHLNLLTEEISSCQALKKTYETEFNRTKESIEWKINNFKEKLSYEFDNQTKEYSADEVKILKETFDKDIETYQKRYLEVLFQFEESKKNKEEIEKSEFSFPVLENVLLGSRIKHFDNISVELNELNQNMNQFIKLQKDIVLNVFTYVDSLYNEYKKQIEKLNMFFLNRKVSDDFTLNIEFKAKKSINKIDGKTEPIINWVRRMKESAKSRDIFSIETKSAEIKPEELIEKIVEKFYDAKTIDFNELINPKTYFELETKFIDKEGVPHPPSSGQGYTVIVLLCVARLAVIKKTDNVHKGIKFVILEEIGTLDDINFELATKDGFQVITMNPRPYSSYSEEGAYVHMLTKGKEDSVINYKPLSVFKKKGIQEDLQDYILNLAKK